MENLGLFGLIPGELRNHIYDLTLTHRPGREASAALLSTCKQIHTEAQALLHQNSIFHLDLDFGGRVIVVAGDVNGHYLGENAITPFPSDGQSWRPHIKSIGVFFPPWALRVPRIVLAIDISSDPASLNSFLLYLSMFVRTQGSAVKEIDIDIRNFVDFKQRHFWGRLLYPITKLPREISLTLRLDGIHEEIPGYIRQFRDSEDQESTGPLQFNPFKEISDLKHDVERILRPELEWDIHPQFSSGYLHIVGQELWTMLTHKFEADAKICKLQWYCITNDRALDFYTRVLKQVLRKLESGPDADEQKRYLVSSWTLQHMMFTPMRLDMTRRYHTAVHKRPWMLTGSNLLRPRKRDWPFAGDACTPM